MEDNRSTGAEDGAPTGGMPVLLPASPEALVAGKYDLDVGENAPSFLMGRRDPEEELDNPRFPVSGNEDFREGIERPQIVCVPRSLINWMAKGPKPDDGCGGYGYAPYVERIAEALNVLISGGMKCRILGLTKTQQRIHATEGSTLWDARHREVKPPYAIVHWTWRLAGPPGSESVIILHLVTRPFWLRDEGEVALQWRTEDDADDAGSGGIGQDRLSARAAGGQFALLDGRAGIKDVAMMLCGIYQAVDLHQTRRAMAREYDRWSAAMTLKSGRRIARMMESIKENAENTEP